MKFKALYTILAVFLLASMALSACKPAGGTTPEPQATAAEPIAAAPLPQSQPPPSQPLAQPLPSQLPHPPLPPPLLLSLCR